MTEGADDLALRHRLSDAARAASLAAGVTVRDLEADEMAAASALLAEVWRTRAPREPDGARPPGRARLRRQLRQRRLRRGRDHGRHLRGLPRRSAPAACCTRTSPPSRAGQPAAGIGTALKLHQRAWCAERDIGVVAWTYDPLIARNAWFNLGRLGAHVEAYLVDFYGPMDDGLNAGEESDRLLVHWPVEPEEVVPPTSRSGRSPPSSSTPDGGPRADLAVPRRHRGGHARGAGRRRGAAGEPPPGARATASRWRATFREAYAALHEQGWHVRGFTRAGHYVLGRPAPERPEPTLTLSLDSVVLHLVRLPLVSPFTTSFGTEREKVALLVEARTTASVGGVTHEVTGWGECVAMEEPLYSSEYVAGVQAVLVDHLLPRLFAAQRERPLTAETVGEVLAPVVGHPMAKAALEMALLDAQLRAAGHLVRRLPRRDRRPGPVRASRSASRTASRRCSTWSRATSTRATAGSSSRSSRVSTSSRPGPSGNGSATSRSRSTRTPRTPSPTRRVLRRLDAFDLLLVEQPLAEDDLRQHALLAAAADHAGLPRRVDRLRRAGRRRPGPGRGQHHQHQARPGRRLPRGASHPRPLPRVRRRRLVRRHARDRPRPGRERRARRPARVHADRRHLRLRPLLRRRPHRRPW